MQNIFKVINMAARTLSLMIIFRWKSRDGLRSRQYSFLTKTNKTLASQQEKPNRKPALKLNAIVRAVSLLIFIPIKGRKYAC